MAAAIGYFPCSIAEAGDHSKPSVNAEIGECKVSIIADIFDTIQYQTAIQVTGNKKEQTAF